LEIGCVEFDHPKIRIPLHLPRNIGISGILIHRSGAGRAQPGRPAFGVADLGEYLHTIASAQYAKDATAIGVPLAQHSSGPPGHIGKPDRHGNPNASFYFRVHGRFLPLLAPCRKPRAAPFSP